MKIIDVMQFFIPIAEIITKLLRVLCVDNVSLRKVNLLSKGQKVTNGHSL